MIINPWTVSRTNLLHACLTTTHACPLGRPSVCLSPTWSLFFPVWTLKQLTSQKTLFEVLPIFLLSITSYIFNSLFVKSSPGFFLFVLFSIAKPITVFLIDFSPSLILRTAAYTVLHITVCSCFSFLGLSQSSNWLKERNYTWGISRINELLVFRI